MSNWSNIGWFNIDDDKTTFAMRLYYGWNLVSIPLNMSEDEGGEGKSGGEGKEDATDEEGGEKGLDSGGGNNCTVYNVSKGISGNTSDVPPTPSLYEGYALVNGSLVSDGTNVSVYVNETNELVGRGSTCSDGEYNVIIHFDNVNNSTDGNAQTTDVLYWQIDDDNATTSDQGDYRIVSVGDIPTKIVDYDPTSASPSVKVGESLEFAIITVAPNYDTLTYLWMVNGNTRNITSSWNYAPNAFEVGTENVTVIASSDTDSDSHEWNVTVQAQCSGNYPYPVGDWNITSNTSCSNTIITLSENANLNVIGNVTLEFDNVTLILDNGTLTAYDGGNANSIIDSVLNTIIDWIT
jgi:hypothetical protein